MERLRISLLLVLLLALTPFANQAPPLVATHAPAHGPAVAMSIDVDRTTLSADQAMLVGVDLRDASGAEVQGSVNWSVSNGSIEPTGLFLPWTAGVVEITAEHGGLMASVNVTVVPGRPIDLELDMQEVPVVGLPFRLVAAGIDAKGNVAPVSNVAWFIDGDPKGVGAPVVSVSEPGVLSVVMRLNDIEVAVELEVMPDEPVAFVFSEGLHMRSGEGLRLEPLLVDSNGFPMPWSVVGGVQWSSNHGVVSAEGVFYPNRPGVWNVSATAVAGNVTGNGTVAVLPADAALLEIHPQVNTSTPLPAGQEVELVAYLSDSLGAQAPVVVPLTNWSIPSGRVANGPNGPLWTPTDMGPVTISVEDSGLLASLTLQVGFGAVQSMIVDATHTAVSAGDHVVLTALAVDEAQNRLPVNATWDMVSGNVSMFSVTNGVAFLSPVELGPVAMNASWTSPLTNVTHAASWSANVVAGRLARISFDLESNLVPADMPVDLSPRLVDAFGHTIEGVALNWSVDGADVTDALQGSDARWAPTTLGGHVIRANADGVFGLVRLTVEPGAANTLVLDDAIGPMVVAGSPIDVRLERIDLHGNMGPAVDVRTDAPSDVAVVEASTSGPGWWTILPKAAGPLQLSLLSDEAVLTLDLEVVAGPAVRLFIDVNGTEMAQGKTALVAVQGVDTHGNLVDVDEATVSVACTAGSVSHLVDGTWLLDLEASGDDRSCTARSNEGLIAQTWFEVEPVLLGGVFGSSNTVVGLGGLLLLGVAVLLLVMLRGTLEDDLAQAPMDQTDLVQREGGKVAVPLEEEAPTPSSTSVARSPRPTLTDDERSTMAASATSTGVMVAVSGTTQGSTGWYVDANATVQHWTVGADGSWTKTEDD